MSTNRPTRDSISIEETPFSNMRMIAAIVEVLERKGWCTKQDLYDIITEFRCKSACARIPETAFPQAYLLAETENEIIDGIMEVLNENRLTLHQSVSVLERLARMIGDMAARGKGDDTRARMRWRDHGMQTGGPPPRFTPESIPIHTSLSNDPLPSQSRESVSLAK